MPYSDPSESTEQTMSRFKADGTKEATNLFEAAAWQYAVRVTCGRCGHSAVFDPHALWWLFERKRWNDSLPAAARRFACMDCRSHGRREPKGLAGISLVDDQPTTTDLPLPPEREWKRAINRFRS